MKNASYKIIFDFSLYYGNEVKFEEYYCLKDSISSIIKNSKHLNEEMKEQLIINPPRYTINGKLITEDINFESIGIENGSIIIVSKTKKKRRIKNSKKNEYISKDYLITSNRINTISTFRKEKDEQENEIQIISPQSKGKCYPRVFWISSIISLFLITAIIIPIILHKFHNIKFKEKKRQELTNYFDEKLISKLNYKLNQIYNLLDVNRLTYIYEPKNNSKIPRENRNFNLTEYVHYTFGIEKENYEIDHKTNIKKNIYHGFLAINNITIENETDIIINLYLNEINKNKNTRFLKDLEKLRYLNEKQILLNINDKDDFTQPIIHLTFTKME